jgi:hypothetical protein
LVEQWIENPCVPGSIPGETTNRLAKGGFLFQSEKKFARYKKKYYFCTHFEQRSNKLQHTVS